MDNKMLDLDLTENGAQRIMNLLTLAQERLTGSDNPVFSPSLYWMDKGYLQGAKAVLSILDIKPVFLGDECVGLIAKEDES